MFKTFFKFKNVEFFNTKIDFTIVIGDFNIKVGREGIFGPLEGNFTLYGNTSNNGLRLISFAAAKHMVTTSTRFQHLDVHKAAVPRSKYVKPN